MNELIEALMILSKYLTESDYAYKWPTSCYNGEMKVSVSPKVVLPADMSRLLDLGFQPDFHWENFVSIKYGSN